LIILGAFTRPIVDRWVKSIDEYTGVPYYYNEETEESTWEDSGVDAAPAEPAAATEEPAEQTHVTDDAHAVWQERLDPKTGR